MPIYEFACAACGSRMETIRPMGDTGEGLTCEACGKGPMERVWSTFAASSGGSKGSLGAGPSCGSGGFG